MTTDTISSPKEALVKIVDIASPLQEAPMEVVEIVGDQMEMADLSRSPPLAFPQNCYPQEMPLTSLALGSLNTTTELVRRLFFLVEK